MAAAGHNAAVDQFGREFRATEPEAVAEFLTLVLDRSVYPDGFPHSTRAFYRPEPREAVVEYELPPQWVIPVRRVYKYVQNRDDIDTLARPAKEIKDQATGQPVRPCLINVSAKREQFATFVHADLDPVAYLRKLNALVSLHPMTSRPSGPS